MGDQHEPEFLETETIDFKRLFDRNVASAGMFDLRGLETTSLGKLLQTIPVPALLVDGACAIAFTNQASESAGFHAAPQQPGSFSLLFADAVAASSAEALIKKVFATRKSEVIEAPLKKGKSHLWGRMHLRSLRVGKRRSVLVIVEDLTLENRRENLEQKHLAKVQRAKDQLEKRLTQSAANLRLANSMLRKETAERKRIEETLKKTKEKLEKQAEQLKEATDLAHAGSRKKGAGAVATETSSKRDDSRPEPVAMPNTVKDFRNFLQVVRSLVDMAKEDLENEDASRMKNHVDKLVKHCAIAAEKIASHVASYDQPK
jgi:hypothetical protein